MDNILFFLTPKARCVHLMADDTLRQALARMESARYAALPILNRRGEYCGTLTEGDALWALMNNCGLDIHTWPLQVTALQPYSIVGKFQEQSHEGKKVGAAIFSRSKPRNQPNITSETF